tara:strand:- start:565 stop:762 length:198 start_codon:yes stop_codon:yes gene_type:complete
MTKNEILNRIIENLLSQRKELNYELKNLNHNESSYMEKRNTLQQAINDIDMQLDRRVMDCEMNVQ